MVHARPIRRYFDAQDDKINRTSHFNYLSKQICFVQARYTDFSGFPNHVQFEITERRCAGVKEFIQNLLITPEAKQYDQYDNMLITIQSKNRTYDMMYA